MHANIWHKTLLGVALLSLLYGFYRPETPAGAEGRSGHPASPPIYPKDYFASPVHDALRLGGTFCELRPNHFHSGIDIKSKTGGVGQPVLAAADGYIDRIKVQASGYGNVLYIKHPNGYTTLYAHLDRFAPHIERYVREQQYKRERFEVELAPPDGSLRVRKGEEIGKLGNSGSSSGPHLHFEIRNTATGKSINPLLFGFSIDDRVPPDIRDMKVYFLNEKREVLGSKALPVRRQKNGRFGLEGDTLRLGAWRVGFGVKTYDQMNHLQNDNGVYSISLWANDALAYQWLADDLEFDETRYLNAHIDYAASQRQGAWFNRCFLLPGNRFSGYTRTETLGAVPLYKDKPTKISLKVADASGNTQSITFWALRDEYNMQTFSPPPAQHQIPYDADTRVDFEDFSMTIGKGVLYETLPLQYAVLPDQDADVYSPIHHVHDDETPAHRNFDLSIRPTRLPASLRDKAFIAYCGEGRPENCGGTWRDEYLHTRVRTFGNYCVMADTVPPTIRPVVFDEDMRRKSSMSFRIYDNFPTSGQADGLSYRGTVDGQWVLFEYDKKRSRLAHTFDGRIGSGEHWLRLVVRDDRGNQQVLERRFVR